jgi:RNA recognition motif-containing protein
MKRVFVGNLDFRAAEDMLRELFAQHGPVDQVTIVKDGSSGQPRGFAFVEMANAADADKAIAALNGTQFGTRTLNVNEARPRPERVQRAGGERYRRGGRW